MPLAVHGWALVCAAGASAGEAAAALGRAPAAATPLRLGQGELAADYPYRPIDLHIETQGEPDWTARTHRWVRQVIDAAGVGQAGQAGKTKGAAMWLVASSSLDIGRVDATGQFSAGTLTLAEELAAAMHFAGPLLAVDSACTSSFHALTVAQTLLEAAAPEEPESEALVLGLELRSRFVPAGFAAMQLTSPWPAPGGLVLGEGVAALRVSLGPGRWRITGIAQVVDGAQPAGTSAAALRDAIASACAAAGIAPRAIGRVKVHAAGHAEGDAIEAEVLAACLSPAAERVHFKPWLGHTQGASGALETALLLELAARQSGWQSGWQSARQSAPGRPVRHTLVLGLGFGGGHAALVLEDGHA